jgi:hypothetical protein
MPYLFDPSTTDLLFTLASTMGILGAAAITLWALPWTDAEIAATEATADQWIRIHPHPARIRSTR